MRFLTLHRRSLICYWRVNLAAALCVAVAGAVLTGALVVGDSMKGSLRENALARLGSVDHAVAGGRYFREALAGEIEAECRRKALKARVCPAILLEGTIEAADTGTYVGRVNVLGVDDRFWGLDDRGDSPAVSSAPAGTVALNEALARRLGATAGMDVLLRLGRSDEASPETLLGRRDDAVASMRLTAARIVPGRGLGGFGLRPTQREALNAFVPLGELQRSLKRPGQVNAMLFAHGERPSHADDDARNLTEALRRHIAIADVGLRLRRDDGQNTVVCESDSVLLDPHIESVVLGSAFADRAPTPVLAYLANTIAVESAATAPAPLPPTAQRAREIPYSVVAALAPPPGRTSLPLTLHDGHPAPPLNDDDILLNDWAATDLGACVGDRIRLTYYLVGPHGRMETAAATFTLRGIVRMDGLAANRTLVPEYRGITDTKRLSDWDPPFPIDIRRIRPRDEEYWDRYGPTPKAFVSLPAGRRLWAQTYGRFGRLTSVRLAPVGNESLDAAAAEIARSLAGRLDPGQLGIAVRPVRAQAIAAGEGSTDFAMLFTAFSFFLIAASVMLIVLTFRLGVERRSPELGTLLAVGFSPRLITRLLATEGLVVAVAGAAIGVPPAIGYAGLMLAGLRFWWSDAVQAPFLRLHLEGSTLTMGLVGSVVVGWTAAAWAVRGLSRKPPRWLLAGTAVARVGPVQRRTVRVPAAAALIATALAVAMVAASILRRDVPQAPAFFATGAMALIAAIAALAAWLRRAPHNTNPGPGPLAITRLGIRNAARNPLRTMLTVGLFASATFIVVAVGASRRDAAAESGGRHTGTGGFALLAESAIPVQHDLNTADGRRSAGLSPADERILAGVRVMPFRLMAGDESSCLNLYRPGHPRILGAPPAMIERGGFAFQSSLAGDDDERRNPWRLLDRPLPDGAVPVIGDANTVLWLLHLQLGKDLVIADGRGRPTRLRFVGLLAGSVLQGELVMAESRFVELFPAVSGYGFFLVDANPADAAAVRKAMKNGLRRHGLETVLTTAKLAQYAAVENAYLAAFQTLGGLGIVLGTLGLAAVLLRNAFERRGELALLRALGYRASDLQWMMLAENGGLLLAGTAIGTLSGLVAVLPHAAMAPAAVPWPGLCLTLAAIIATGLFFAATAAAPGQLKMSSLRAE